MKVGHLKYNLCIIGLIVSVMLFLNILIQCNKSYGFNAKNHSQLSWALSGKNKALDYLTERKDESIQANTASSVDLFAQSNLAQWQERLKLLGTIIGKPSLAFISDLDSGKFQLYKKNDEVCGARIVSITAGRVVLDKDGSRQELLLENVTTGANKNKNLVIAAVLPNEMIVSRSGVINQLDRAKELLAKVKILPVPDNLSGKLKGFRIDNVPSGSIIEQAGVESGDLIFSVQGQRLESTQDALRIFKYIQNQSNIEVDLLRGEEPVTLRYVIRE